MPRYRADQNKIEKTRETPEQWSLPWARCGGESTTGASRLTRSLGERLNSRERDRASGAGVRHNAIFAGKSRVFSDLNSRCQYDICSCNPPL